MNATSNVSGECNALNHRANAYILRALGLAKTYAARQRPIYKFSGSSCYVINAMALSAVISTRHGNQMSMFGAIPLTDGDGPDCEALACADHYLDRRNLISLKGAGSIGQQLWANAAAIPIYDVLKSGVMALEALPSVPPGAWVANPVMGALGLSRMAARRADHLMREDRGRPLSKPSIPIDVWAAMGLAAGYHDYKNNSIGKLKTDNNPKWFADLPVAKKYTL